MIKIHVSRMAYRFQTELYNRIKGVQAWEVLPHVAQRQAEKVLTFKLDTVIKSGKLVEFHTMAGTDRVVLEIDNGKSRDSVTLDLTTSQVVTAYSRENEIKGRNNKHYMGGSR